MQEQDPTSHLNLYKNLVKLRKDPVFLTGGFEFCIVNAETMSFVRHKDGMSAFLVVANFGKHAKVENFTRAKIFNSDDFILTAGKLIVDTNRFSTGLRDFDLRQVKIEARQGFVVEFMPSQSSKDL